MTKSFARLLLGAILTCTSLAASAAANIDRVEPAFWWVGMKNSRLQILLHGSEELGLSKIELTPYPGVTIEKVERVSNKKYTFVYLNIASDAKPGKLTFQITGKGTTSKLPYELKARDTKVRAQGYDQSDVIYLIMPDRFANGNPKNDDVKAMQERPDRKAPFGRHGGDIAGVTQHLDYFKKLGVTGIWLNPVQENDMKHASYHGYAITDFYNVDRRFGSMAEYSDMIAKAHAGGLKVVMDMVMNHMGTNHYWLKDLPDSTFINFWPQHTQSNFRATVPADPYSSKWDRDRMVKGWFARTMADINGENPLVADYLIQNCIWWIEYTCIDDIRMDTYPYPEKNFMNKWASSLTAEYPKLNLVGEVWVEDSPALASYYVHNNKNFNGFASTEPTIMDFSLKDAIQKGLTDPKPDWSNGLVRIYNCLAVDFLLETPERNLIFCNNHDMSRVATVLKEDPKKVRQALALLLTLRGVPHLYYGEEWFMTGDAVSHPNVRRDFPGGWAGDSADFFTGRNAGKLHQETFDFYRKLLNWRKGATPIHNGKLMQFVPEDNIYVYFRYDRGRQVMVVINGNQMARTLDLGRFQERLMGHKLGKEVISDAMLDLTKPLQLEAQGAIIIDMPPAQP